MIRSSASSRAGDVSALAAHRDAAAALGDPGADAEAAAGAQRRPRAFAVGPRLTDLDAVPAADARQRVGHRVEIVDDVEAGELQVLGELQPVEAPVAVRHLHLVAVDRRRDGDGAGFRPLLAARDVAVEEILQRREVVVLHHLELGRTPVAGAAHGATRRSGADVGDQPERVSCQFFRHGPSSRRARLR